MFLLSILRIWFCTHPSWITRLRQYLITVANTQDYSVLLNEISFESTIFSLGLQDWNNAWKGKCTKLVELYITAHIAVQLGRRVQCREEKIPAANILSKPHTAWGGEQWTLQLETCDSRYTLWLWRTFAWSAGKCLLFLVWDAKVWNPSGHTHSRSLCEGYLSNNTMSFWEMILSPVPWLLRSLTHIFTRVSHTLLPINEMIQGPQT